MSDKLLPCPFCGSFTLSLDDLDTYMRCDNCLAFGPSKKADEEADALDLWNKRATNGEHAHMLEELAKEAAKVASKQATIDRLAREIDELRRKLADLEGENGSLRAMIALGDEVEL